MNSKSVLVIEPSADLYGTGRMVLAMASSLIESGHSVTVWSPQDLGLHGRLRAVGAVAEVMPLPTLRRQEWNGPFAVARSAARLAYSGLVIARAARRLEPKPDVVHAVTLSSLAGIVAARALGRPLCWSVHETVRSVRERRVFSWLLSRAQSVVTCSAYVASQFPGILSTVIPSGADLLSLSRVDTSEPLTRDPTTVVCVGRLNRWKGQDVLVRAIGELRDQGRTVRCQLVGGAFVTDQEVERNLVQLVDGMGLGDQVELLGDLADPSVVVANADIAVVPSKVAEPFGKVVVEAMALGRPIVATAAGGPLEVINDELNGLLVPPDDAVALAKAIARYLDDPVWARGLGRAARVRAQDFDERDAATAYRVEMERLAACP